MASAAERSHVDTAPTHDVNSFWCILCQKTFSKRSAFRHFVGSSTHALDQELVKQWVVVKEGHRLGNNTRRAAEPAQAVDHEEVNTDDDHQDVVVMDDEPDTVEYHNPVVPVTVLDTPQDKKAALTVDDSDEEMRSFAKRCPIPRSWSSTTSLGPTPPMRRRIRGKTSQ
jgi:hypothetical protein